MKDDNDNVNPNDNDNDGEGNIDWGRSVIFVIRVEWILSLMML